MGEHSFFNIRREDFDGVKDADTVCMEDGEVKAVSQGIYLYAMIHGVNEITPKTAKEFLKRVRDLEEIGAGCLTGYILTEEDVAAHMGFRSMATPMAARQWVQKLQGIRYEQAKKLVKPMTVVWHNGEAHAFHRDVMADKFASELIYGMDTRYRPMKLPTGELLDAWNEVVRDSGGDPCTHVYMAKDVVVIQ